MSDKDKRGWAVNKINDTRRCCYWLQEHDMKGCSSSVYSMGFQCNRFIYAVYFTIIYTNFFLNKQRPLCDKRVLIIKSYSFLSSVLELAITNEALKNSVMKLKYKGVNHRSNCPVMNLTIIHRKSIRVLNSLNMGVLYIIWKIYKN